MLLVDRCTQVWTTYCVALFQTGVETTTFWLRLWNPTIVTNYLAVLKLQLNFFWNLKHLPLVIFVLYFARIIWTMCTAKRLFWFGQPSSCPAEDHEVVKFQSRHHQRQLWMVSTNADNYIDFWFKFNKHFMHCDTSTPSTAEVAKVPENWWSFCFLPFVLLFLLHFSTSNIEIRGWSWRLLCKVKIFWNAESLSSISINAESLSSISIVNKV